MKKVLTITFFVLLVDQLSKYYVKTHFYLGEDFTVFNWFHIKFVENPGMAFGLSFGQYYGKIALTVFRIFLIMGIAWWINDSAKKLKSNFFLVPMAFIFAGALGNLIDSVFYGLLFDSGTMFNEEEVYWQGYQGLSQLDFNGYANLFAGTVVDMFYFPFFEGNYPLWLPLVGGTSFGFFSYIFNVADASISLGVFIMLLFQKKAFKETYG